MVQAGSVLWYQWPGERSTDSVDAFVCLYLILLRCMNIFPVATDFSTVT